MNYIFVTLFGLVVGSFLNVCIYRIPEGKSIFRPGRSFCPKCGEMIAWYDNIPVLSYIVLRGRCRRCGERISPIYPLVELLTAAVFIVMWWRFGLSVEFFGYAIMSSILIAVSFIDLAHYIIPNKFTFPGIGLSLVFATVMMLVYDRPSLLVGRLVGIIIGGLAILIMGLIGSLIFRKEAMGMGDVKLVAMIGGFLGFYPHIIVVILLSAVLGSVVGITYMIVRRVGFKKMIPYGPFLSAAAIVSALYGESLWNWYRSLLH